MSSSMFYFLILVAPALALLLACLGIETTRSNLLGWFLALMGIGYLVGGIIYYWQRKGKVSVISKEVGDRSFWLILPGFLAIFFGAPLEYLYIPNILPHAFWCQGIGLALIGASVALRIWTRLTIREMYTGHIHIQADHRLVQEGPYRYIRHPGYTGFLLMALGLSIGYSSLIGLAAIPLLLFPGLLYRMKVEEKLLSQAFSDEYHRYSGKTKRLIPGVW